ncbi:hypothetical protein QQF64_036180 [Cirrhinus molitorella]|uniref:Uncharacterized protein n=1 Tax=Cirrhinus molitorella TaxID=172907 RepID=A0ABR3NHT7_9TELE
MTLTESEDAIIRTAAPRVVAGRKWTPSEAVRSAKSALYLRDVVGQVQHGRAGFGLIPRTPLWHKATSAQKRQLVVEEIRRQEEGERYAKAQWLSRGNGPTGRAWRKKSSAGVTSGKWTERG